MRPLIPGLAAALALAACSQPASGGKTADQLKAELPAPFNTGDVAAGKQVFSQCAACHTITQGGSNGVGPNLYGVFGAKAGSRPASFMYTDGVKALGWTWDAAHIDTWITDPKAVVPGTKMAFVGVKDPKQRIDVIAYLKVASSGGPT